MDYWAPDVVYQMVADQHRERVARGEAAQRLALAPGTQSIRSRLAILLVALARQLDPARLPALPDGAVHAPHVTA